MTDDKLDNYFKKWWNDDMDNFDKKVFRTFGAVWVAAVVINLGIIGVGIWAVIKLVNRFA